MNIRENTKPRSYIHVFFPPKRKQAKDGVLKEEKPKKEIKEKEHTFMQRLPVQMICWILPGTSMDLNFAGKSGALCGTCKSPKANTSTIFNPSNIKSRSKFIYTTHKVKSFVKHN